MNRLINLITLNGEAQSNDNLKHASVNLSALTENQGSLTVSANTEITVIGKENRSTGYQWQVMENTCGAKLVQKTDEYLKNANSGMMGAGGMRQWTFQSLPENANYIRGLPCTVTFAYKRPWLELEDSPSDRKKITVVIN